MEKPEKLALAEAAGTSFVCISKAVNGHVNLGKDLGERLIAADANISQRMINKVRKDWEAKKQQA